MPEESRTDEPACALCRKPTLYSPEEAARGYCERCQGDFGLPTAALAESRRPPRPCTRCQHGELVRALVRERGATGGDYVHAMVRPLSVTFAREVSQTFWSGREKVGGPDIDKPIGLLEAFVCRACGFVEWYALAPETIPIGVEYATSLVKAGDAPYR